MANKRYNGWTNYETWNVSLWIDNDQGLYEMAREMAQEIHEEGPRPIDDTSLSLEPKHILADRLKDWIGEMAPDLGASMWSDLLNAALSEVDWTEIAENMLSEYTDAEEE